MSLTLRQDALAIWRAGLDAVCSDRLVEDNVRVESDSLVVAGEPMPLAEIERIVVVGAGKAGAGMAAGLERALGPQLMATKDLQGWVNVPADCAGQLERIKLHAARPAGRNEPTEQGVAGSGEILRLVESCSPRDLCLCLISGGGSALLPAPVEGISLADKQAVTRFLSGAGANIEELNTVRKHLSRLKGGGLARACRAGRLITLIISDVIGDPLDLIASGPTVVDPSTPADALRVLESSGGVAAGAPSAVIEYLKQAAAEIDAKAGSQPGPTAKVSNHIIGNNAVAVDAAGREAERRGYSAAMLAATELEGAAEEVGRHHARMALKMREESGPDCLITGGEPTVTLAPPNRRGQGGRNQQLVLAALAELLAREGGVSAKPGTGGASGTPAPASTHPTSAPRSALRPPLHGIAVLAGGTDGEDGPTDAAGAFIDEAIAAAALEAGLDIADALDRNDAYNFFQPLGALVMTGPTHTNVCDLRVVVAQRKA